MVWSSILRHRYDNPELKVLVEDSSVLCNKDSIWWRDLILSDNSVDSNDRFAGDILSKVVNGPGTSFWHSKRLGHQLL